MIKGGLQGFCLVGALSLTALSIAGCKKGSEGGAEGGVSSSASASGSNDPPPCAEDKNKKLTDGKITACLITKEYPVDGFVCEANKTIELRKDGHLAGCYLKTAKVVSGYSCKDGLALQTDGKLHRCKLTAARNVGGIDLRPGDWVTLFDGKEAIRRVELGAGPNKILGMPCIGYLNFLHENGKLKKCELSEDVTIEGKKVAFKSDGGSSVYVCFDEQGKRVLDCNTLTGMSTL